MSKPVIVTHNGGFHADDCFAVATLLLHLKKGLDDVDVVRTRDPELIRRGDFVVDVGMEHDPARNRFDHHQEGGAGNRENGIPYASFGLVWKEYGHSISGSDEAFDMVDNSLVAPVDANDSGYSISKPQIEGVREYGISSAISSFVPIDDVSDDEMLENFIRAVTFAKAILGNEISFSRFKSELIIKIADVYQKSKEKNIIIFDDAKGWPWQFMRGRLAKFSEPIFFVREHRKTGWQVFAVEEKGFDNRKDFSLEWAGKKDEELQKITGVSDAIFCHNGRFMCVAGSKEGAIALAELALKR